MDAQVALLPAYGGELDAGDSLINYATTPRTWMPPEYSDVVVPGTGEFTREDRIVSRVEFELQADFGEWLNEQGTPPERLPLRAGSTIVEPDLFVPERGWIVEAKRSTARAHVRMAIGQALDYVHIALKAGLQVKAVILLPGQPEADLRELIARLKITLATRSEDGFAIAEL